VGLDPDINRMPLKYQSVAAIPEFLDTIIRATQHVASAYKINTAFFEQYGLEGIKAMFKTRELVGSSFCIIDAKRGDIGNTSGAYARALFTELRADAVTVAPYMGSDSIQPFLDTGFTYILALTSNVGSANFQLRHTRSADGSVQELYRCVMDTVLQWPNSRNVGFVVGATHSELLAEIRSAYRQVPFLIPGIGAQGALADEVKKANGGAPALFNVSRAVLYAGTDQDFCLAACAAAEQFAAELSPNP